MSLRELLAAIVSFIKGNSEMLIGKLDTILAGQLRLEQSIMALNAEVQAYADRVFKGLDGIRADIQKILDSQTSSLSDEDRATLEKAVSAVESLDAERA